MHPSNTACHVITKFLSIILIAHSFSLIVIFIFNTDWVDQKLHHFKPRELEILEFVCTPRRIVSTGSTGHMAWSWLSTTPSPSERWNAGAGLELGPVSRKLQKLFRATKPFLAHLYLKTERCTFRIKNIWIKELCNHKVWDFARAYRMPLLVGSPIKPTQDKSQFWFQVWHFSVWISDYFVSLSVSSLNNLELNKTETVKTIANKKI